MKGRSYVARGLAAVTGVVLLFSAQVAHAELIFGVTVLDRLVSFDSATPTIINSTVVITGTQPGEIIRAIDFRPATGQLYGLGSDSRLYTINTTTGAATQVGSAGAFTLNGSSFGFDFNPTVDRIRVVSDADQNLRLNPNDGTLTTTDSSLAYAAADLNVGINPNVGGSAYTNNFAGALTTTLYGLDFGLDILATQNPPNAGVLNTVGPLGINVNDFVGFDISGATGVAYAALALAGQGVSQLYTVNLNTGAATLTGTILTFAGVRDISVATPVPEPATILLLGTGLAMVARRRFHARR